MVSTRQLLRIGYTKEEISGLLKAGLLHPLHRGVYVVGHRNISNRGHLTAALLAAPPGAFLSHSTSVAYLGLRPINIHRLELTVVSQGIHARPGLIVHRTAAPPHRTEVVSRFGLRYSSFPRAVIELSTREAPDELLRLVTAAVRKQIFDADKLAATLARHPQRPGTRIVKNVLDRYLEPADRKSGLERSFDEHTANDPRIPPYEKNIHIGPYEIDCWFPQHRVALELDGRPYHTAIDDLDRDRAKDVWLQLHQIIPIRVTDFGWEHDRARAITDLLALLALGADRRAA